MLMAWVRDGAAGIWVLYPDKGHNMDFHNRMLIIIITCQLPSLYILSFLHIRYDSQMLVVIITRQSSVVHAS